MSVIRVGSEDPQIAAEAASTAVNSSAPLTFGPVDTAVSLAMAPIVQRGKLPTIFTQSGGPGVNAGDYTYIATTPGQELIDRTLGAYLKAKGVRTLAILSNTDNPAAVQTAQTLVEFCTQNGIKAVSAADVPSTTTDFTAIASRAVSAKPAAVYLLLFGSQNVTAIRQLRADGYTGMIVGTDGLAGGVLTPLGSAANGVVYFTNYTAGFWFAARALKLANSTDRPKVLAALESVATTGFEARRGTSRSKTGSNRRLGFW